MKIANEQELEAFSAWAESVMAKVPPSDDPLTKALVELSKNLLAEYEKLLKQHLEALKVINILVEEGDSKEEFESLNVV